MTEAVARDFIDRASAAAASALDFDPWRQTYTLDLYGSGTGFLKPYAKPIESVTTVEDADGSAYTDYRIGSNGSGILDRLERDAGWPKSFDGGIGTSLTEWSESEKDAWTLTGITEGWLMPGQVQNWAAATTYVATIASTSQDDAAGAAYAVGSWVRSYNPAIELRFECTSGGTSHATTEPAAFQTAEAGDEITDDGVTWTARAAKELPKDLEEAVLGLALALWQGRDRDRGIQSERGGGVTIVYTDAAESFESVWGVYR